MTLSIVIPTHNRANQLRSMLGALQSLADDVDFEVIVVDNNSTDSTGEVARSFGSDVQYVFEPSTAFSKARRTGATRATGRFLLFVDDDVIISPGSLVAVVDTFGRNSSCAVVAGQIVPKFEVAPPDWTIACQRTFNGWSLYNPDVIPDLGSGAQQVEWAAGPMMAVRRDAFFAVDGFPADTVGVETNLGQKSFRKLYVGPGDYGLSYLLRKKGFSVLYEPRVLCQHVIPPTRLTVAFWRSRMIGEAHQRAISEVVFYKLSMFAQSKEVLRARYRRSKWERKFGRRLRDLEPFLKASDFRGMLHEELWVQFYGAYFEIREVLKKHKRLAETLWQIGTDGVRDDEYDNLQRALPPEFLRITNSDRFYDSRPLVTVDRLREFLKQSRWK